MAGAGVRRWRPCTASPAVVGSGGESRERAVVVISQHVLCARLDQVVLGSASCWCLCLDFCLQKVSIQGRTQNRSYGGEERGDRKEGAAGQISWGFTLKAL